MKYFFKRKLLYIFMIFGGLFVLLISIIEGGSLVEIMTEIVAILGVELLVVELHEARLLLQSGVVTSLNKDFVSNEDYQKVYLEFENYDFENCPDLEMENVYISNYLTFFEIFEHLVEGGRLSIEDLNDLFGYRFLLAVHNPYVQRTKLCKSPDNFRNIYILEKRLMEYRKKNGYPIYHEEYALKNMIDEKTYEKIIHSKD